jgi:hypothetical protein
MVKMPSEELSNEQGKAKTRTFLDSRPVMLHLAKGGTLMPPGFGA